MPDITNYAYIWYNEANPLSAIRVPHANTIFQYVTSYSYPCYLANNDVSRLSDNNKHQLLHDEIGFIRDIMVISELQGIELVQIPRVLYDLLSLVYFVESRTHISVIEIHCKYNGSYQTYASYISHINQYLLTGNNNFKNDILQLNTFILKKIGYIVGGGEPPSSYVFDTTKKPASTLPMKMTGSSVEDIRLFLSDRNKACESILEHILQAEQIMLPMNFILNLTPQTKELFRQVLRFELQESSGYTTLYRGSVLENDSLIRRSDSGRGVKARGRGAKTFQSVSFNTSILSGCINDDTACTLFYMEPTSTHERVVKLTNSGKNDKIRYTIKKFLKGDNSNEDSLFFIPPIHPLLQLNAKGELFHPRTKVNLDDMKQKKVSGLSCTNNFILHSDYLHSNKTMIELDALYQRFKATGIIDRWYAKPEHQRQYERSRKAKLTLLRSIDERYKLGGGSAQRSTRSSRSLNKQMKVTHSVDKLRGRGTRIRTCKRMRLR